MGNTRIFNKQEISGSILEMMRYNKGIEHYLEVIQDQINSNNPQILSKSLGVLEARIERQKDWLRRIKSILAIMENT